MNCLDILDFQETEKYLNKLLKFVVIQASHTDMRLLENEQHKDPIWIGQLQFGVSLQVSYKCDEIN